MKIIHNRLYFRRFSLIELIGAIVIMAVIMAAAFGMIHGIKRAQIRFAQEGKAITVLENVLVRLPKDQAVAKVELEKVLKQEFDAADFVRKHELEAVVETNDTGADVMIRDAKKNRVLATIRIAYETK